MHASKIILLFLLLYTAYLPANCHLSDKIISAAMHGDLGKVQQYINEQRFGEWVEVDAIDDECLTIIEHIERIIATLNREISAINSQLITICGDQWKKEFLYNRCYLKLEIYQKYLNYQYQIYIYSTIKELLEQQRPAPVERLFKKIQARIIKTN